MSVTRVRKGKGWRQIAVDGETFSWKVGIDSHSYYCPCAGFRRIELIIEKERDPRGPKHLRKTSQPRQIRPSRLVIPFGPQLTFEEYYYREKSPHITTYARIRSPHLSRQPPSLFKLVCDHLLNRYSIYQLFKVKSKDSTAPIVLFMDRKTFNCSCLTLLDPAVDKGNQDASSFGNRLKWNLRASPQSLMDMLLTNSILLDQLFSTCFTLCEVSILHRELCGATQILPSHVSLYIQAAIQQGYWNQSDIHFDLDFSLLGSTPDRTECSCLTFSGAAVKPHLK